MQKTRKDGAKMRAIEKLEEEKCGDERKRNTYGYFRDRP